MITVTVNVGHIEKKFVGVTPDEFNLIYDVVENDLPIQNFNFDCVSTNVMHKILDIVEQRPRS